MPALKAYTLGINGMPKREVIEALGLSSWIRQVEVCPIERSKAAAHALLETRRIFIPIGDTEFRVSHDSYIDALRDAELLDEPAVFAWPLSSGGEDKRVVRIEAGGAPVLIGQFTRIERKPVFLPEQT